MKKIPIAKPFFGQEELDAVLKPLKSGWVVQGPFVQELEEKFAAYTSAKYAIATSSGTSALQVSVAAMGLKAGDEVIVPAFTWVATANVVEQLGAKAVFCDVDPTTFNLDVSQLDSLLTDKTVGIIPVHLFGLSAEINFIMDWAKQHKLWVVEDAACGLGSFFQGKHVGRFGELGCFSFHPRKSITTGEGGMITTDSEELAEICRSLRNHGQGDAVGDETTPFLLNDFSRLGFNYRMTDIQGALGSAQMDKLETILAERKRVAARYDQALARLDWLQTPKVAERTAHSYQSYVTLFKGDQANQDSLPALFQERNALMFQLHENGIGTRPGTHAVFLQGYYRGKYEYDDWEYPGALIADKLSMALPLYPLLSEEDQDRVVDTVKSSFAGVG